MNKMILTSKSWKANIVKFVVEFFRLRSRRFVRKNTVEKLLIETIASSYLIFAMFNPNN